MTKRIFLLFLCCFSIVAGSQDVSSGALKDVDATLRWGFTAGYTAYLLTNPGFQLGIEHPLGSVKYFKTMTNLTLRGYFQGEIQSGLQLSLGYGSRVTVPFGFFFENYIKIGYEHYFFTNKTFTFESSVGNIVERKQNKGAFSPDISLGIGYDFSKINLLGLLLFIRPTLAWRIPDRNLAFQNTFYIDGGIIFYPKTIK
jgi:hypothetical protein